MANRKPPNLTEKLAAALRLVQNQDGSPLIPEPLRSSDDPAVICAAVEWDHVYNLVALHGTDNSPRNLRPRLKAQYGGTDHKQKTHGVKHGYAGSDRHKIAKSKRLQAKRAAEPDPTAAAIVGPSRSGSRGRMKSRPMAGTKASGWTKPINGKAKRR